MTTIFANATIVTVDPAQRVLHDAALAVEGDRIVAIGDTNDVAATYLTGQTIDLRGDGVHDHDDQAESIARQEKRPTPCDLRDDQRIEDQ